MGLCHIALGNHKSALEAFKKAVRVNPRLQQIASYVTTFVIIITIIIIVDAALYFLSLGWLWIETKPTPPPAICAMRLRSLLTLNVKG
jgi:hypothetical protein